ncbi:hypothetical protein J3R83DRAFT_13883, partial [Lanmaoa asiatica]
MARAPTAPQRGTTGRTNRKAHMFNNMSKEEALLAIEKTSIKSPDEAIPFLTKNGLSLPDPETDIDNTALLKTLTIALLELANFPKTTQPHIDTLCAIAFSLEKVKINPQPQGPREPRIDSDISDQLLKLEHSTERQEQQTALLTELHHEMKATLDATVSSLGEIIESARESTHNPPRCEETNPYKSYAGVTKENIPRMHAEVLARNEAKEREIVIKCESASTMKLSEKELVYKANLALESTDDADPRPLGMKCLSVRRARENLIILELDRQLSVLWLRSPRNKRKFFESFGTNATLLDQSFRVLAEFVPVTLDTNNDISLREVE